MGDVLPGPRRYDGLIRAHAWAAIAMVGYTLLLGLAVALKFHWPDLMSNSPWVTWGRLRYGHTQGVFFGWLGNAFLMFLYYAVPRLAERPLTSVGLGWALFFVWNFLLVIPGWVLVQAGISQPLEWAEFPLEIDAVVVVALMLSAVQFVLPFLRGWLPELYVSGWYILGGLVFTLLAYPVGNLVPEFVPGARGAAYSGLWIHDAVGLYVTPLALAIAYVVIPAATGRPIFSHFLSMIGFWLLFLVYPLNGMHHFLFSAIPMDAQKGAIVASVYLGVDVILVVANLLLSLRGSAGVVAANVPLRFVWVGTVAYVVVSLQGSMQALLPVNRFTHFSDWVIGHSHLAMIGFASFMAIGGMLHVWERLPGVRYSPRAANWAFWLLTVGLGLMVIDLTAAGLIQGQLWESDAPWMDSVRASRVFWLTRSISGVVLLLGFVGVATAMRTGPRGEEVLADDKVTPWQGERGNDDDLAPAPVAALTASWLGKAYVVTAVAGVGFFVLSFLVLAAWPNQVLEAQIAEARPAHLPSPSPAEQRGRQIYAREGCLNCHSQFIRFTDADVRRFGVASQAWESEHDLPQLWGTRRIGPDLARERGRKSPDWHLVHLWNPRYVVPESIMPAYPWLFDRSPQRPTPEALDLVAYLDSLGRDAQLAGLGQGLPSGIDPEEEKRRGMFCDCAIPRTPGPAPLFATAQLSPTERTRFERLGKDVFARQCSGCHGEQGRGDGRAAVALLPTPRDLSGARFSDEALSDAMWRGRPGSSMPPWHDLSVTDLRGLIAFTRTLVSDASDTVTSLDETQRRQADHLYATNCQDCHGPQGGGATATILMPAPTVFRRVRPTTARAERALADGVPGTSMPAWKDKLNDADRRLLAQYVRKFYLPE
ncbi:MAG: cbb3-type cytochrome c oxidase subunit I [Gemmataceae bacterium]|nr:cbb3-type cytochrome c oxidase subunit I [Gemmataceae bacterium]